MATNKTLISAVLGFLSLVLLPGCKNNTKTAAYDEITPTKEQLIQRGRYLVESIGCSDCHSPKKMGPDGQVVIQTLMFSGFPADRKLQGARTLFPPMPWEDFSNLTDDDVRAIYAFLITTNPVNNVVPMATSLEDVK